jgi:hypothetical protein
MLLQVVVTTVMMGQKEPSLLDQLVLKVSEPQWGRLHLPMLDLVLTLLLLV